MVSANWQRALYRCFTTAYTPREVRLAVLRRARTPVRPAYGTDSFIFLVMTSAPKANKALSPRGIPESVSDSSFAKIHQHDGALRGTVTVLVLDNIVLQCTLSSDTPVFAADIYGKMPQPELPISLLL